MTPSATDLSACIRKKLGAVCDTLDPIASKVAPTAIIALVVFYGIYIGRDIVSYILSGIIATLYTVAVVRHYYHIRHENVAERDSNE